MCCISNKFDGSEEGVLRDGVIDDPESSTSRDNESCGDASETSEQQHTSVKHKIGKKQFLKLLRYLT